MQYWGNLRTHTFDILAAGSERIGSEQHFTNYSIMSNEERIREIFNKFDRDGSGEISARELVEVLREADKEKAPDRDEAARDAIIKKKAGFILVRCDKNDDHKLTWQEFYGGLSSYVD